MTLKIEMASNGWILIDENDTEYIKKVIFEYEDTFDQKNEIEAFSRLLWAINDLIGPTTSRYSKHRIAVRIVKGDKCDDGTEETETDKTEII